MFSPEQPGASNTFGGFGNSITDPRQILTLPGSGTFSFQDEWVPALTTGARNSLRRAFDGAAAFPEPTTTRRSAASAMLLGLIRIDDPNVPNVGFGKYPVPRHRCLRVREPAPARGDGRRGDASRPDHAGQLLHRGQASRAPTRLRTRSASPFSSPIDPNSINSNTVDARGPRASAATTRPGTLISLAGKLSYDVATNTLIINLGASGLTLKTDAYQLILVGSGSQVISSPQGVALDGENLTNNNDPNYRHAAPARPRETGTPAGTSTTTSSSTPPRRR